MGAWVRFPTFEGIEPFGMESRSALSGPCPAFPVRGTAASSISSRTDPLTPRELTNALASASGRRRRISFVAVDTDGPRLA